MYEIVRLSTALRGTARESVAGVAERLGLNLAGIEQRPARELSGGTKQKLLLALAFAAQAELLVLDEPTSSLEAGARRSFFELFHEVAAETTLVLCSHRLEEVEHMVESAVMMVDGRIVFQGQVAELLERQEVTISQDAIVVEASGLAGGRPGAVHTLRGQATT